MSFWTASRAGSATLRLPEAKALMRGLRKRSESEREKSERTPGREGEGEEGSDWLQGDVGAETGVLGDGDGDLLGDAKRSRTDLHSCASLECFSHDPFLMIFSRAGTRIWFRRESASAEAIPNIINYYIIIIIITTITAGKLT